MRPGTFLSRIAPTIAALSAATAAQSHHEQPQQRHLPGVHGGGAPTATVRRGPFVSVQVNVDAQGNDIRDDAANEPSIVVDPLDARNIAIGWRQFDNIASDFRQAGRAYSRDGGASWTFPGSLQPGLFNSDPVLDADGRGRTFYLGYPSGRTLTLFRSMDGGMTFDAGVGLVGGDKAWMLVDRGMASPGGGHVYVIWQIVHGPDTFTRSTNGGSSFQIPVAVPETPTFGTMAVDAAGVVYAGGLQRQNRGTFVMARSDNARNAAAVPSFTTVFVNMAGRAVLGGTPNPGGLLGQIEVDTDPARPGNVYMLCSVQPSAGGDPMDVHFVRSTDGGRTFSQPTRVNDVQTGWQWFGTMSVAPDGRIDVVWNDTRNGGGDATRSETCYAFSHDAGSTWSKTVFVSPQWVSTVAWPVQNKIGDYYDMRSDIAAAHLAYSATHTGQQNTYYLRLGDCNDNGQHDGIDIRTGVSSDANDNVIPDECETCQPRVSPDYGLALAVCGDDLTTAGSRASLRIEGTAAGAVGALVVSTAQLSPPFPLRGNAVLLHADPTRGVVVPLLFDTAGRAVTTITGGPGGVTTLYLQAVAVPGTNPLVASATLAATIGY